MKYNYLLPPGKLPHLSRCNPRSTTNLGLLAAILCSSGSLAPLSGATPPTATVIYTSTGPILGGMAKGPDGVVYLATLSSAAAARVTALNADNTPKWTFTSPVAGTAGDMYGMVFPLWMPE